MSIRNFTELQGDLVDIAKMRSRVERDYQELKQEVEFLVSADTDFGAMLALREEPVGALRAVTDRLRILAFGVKRAVSCLGALETMGRFRDHTSNGEIERLALEREGISPWGKYEIGIFGPQYKHHGARDLGNDADGDPVRCAGRDVAPENDKHDSTIR